MTTLLAGSIELTDDAAAPELRISPAWAPVTRTMIEGLLQTHRELGDYGLTVPEPMFEIFFPSLKLAIESTHPGVCRTWSLTREQWIQLLRSEFDLHFPLPKTLQIELTNRCNLECVMCHAHDASGDHRPLTRKLAFMDINLFRRIIAEAVADPNPARRVRAVGLQAWGESMMHPHIIEAIECARDAGIQEIGLISNGTLIGKKHSVEDLWRAGLTRLQISLDAVHPETYRKIRMRDLFREAEAAARTASRFAMRIRIERALRSLLRMKPIRPFSFTVSFAHQEANDAEAAEFVRRWTPWTFAVQMVPVYFNFDYRNVYFRPAIQRNPCVALWQNMQINADGSVAVCCADYDAKHPVAHLESGLSLADAWRSEAYESFRRDHLEGNGDAVDICSICIGSGSMEKRSGSYMGYPAAFLPHLAYVYRKETWLVRLLRRFRRSARFVLPRGAGLPPG